MCFSGTGFKLSINCISFRICVVLFNHNAIQETTHIKHLWDVTYLLLRRLVVVADGVYFFTIRAAGDHLSILSGRYVPQFVGFKCHCHTTAHWLGNRENICRGWDGLIGVCVWMTDGLQDCCQHPQGQCILRDYPPPADTHSPPVFWRFLDPERSPTPGSSFTPRSMPFARCTSRLWPRKPNPDLESMRRHLRSAT